MAISGELLPLLLLPVFAFLIWAIFEIFTFFIRPGAASELVSKFPGMANGEVLRRKRMLSLYDIYTPFDGTSTQAQLHEAKAMEAANSAHIVSVPPNFPTIAEEDHVKYSEDLPPNYDQVVLSIVNLQNPQNGVHPNSASATNNTPSDMKTTCTA